VTVTHRTLPPGVKGAERRAIKELFTAAKDGVITKAEAQCFAAKNKDLFEKGDHRWLKYITQELTHPGTTYAYSWTPEAKVTAGAKEVLDGVNKDPFGFGNR
jgi:hypothetical protein